jgi:hypothetical protein
MPESEQYVNFYYEFIITPILDGRKLNNFPIVLRTPNSLLGALNPERRKSLLLKETLREREGFANEREVSSLDADNPGGNLPARHRSRLCTSRQERKPPERASATPIS